MRCIKLCAAMAVIFTAVGVATAVDVPLPAPGNTEVKALGSFAEIFLEVKQEVEINGNVLGPGIYNNFAIGVFDSDAATGGIQPGFCLYTGGFTSVAGPAIKPGTVVGVDGVAGFSIGDIFSGTGDFEGVTEGRLYVGGVVNTINSTNSVTYNQGPGDNNPNPQLTFALYNAHVQNLTLNTGSGDQLFTTFELGGDENVHLDIWADDTPDASLGATFGAGQRYAGASTLTSRHPELPVRDDDGSGTLYVDLDDGTYYDRNGGGWGELDFAGNPADDDEVFWSFVGNPESLFQVTEAFEFAIGGETFNSGLDLNGDGDANDLIYISGESTVADPTGLFLGGQLSKGTSLISPATGKVRLDGTGFGNDLLYDGNFILTANFDFGGQDTGAYDSDPRTFTFQQGTPGGVSTLTQITGVTVIPEPLTMLGVVLGVGGVAGYIRKRRA